MGLKTDFSFLVPLTIPSKYTLTMVMTRGGSFYKPKPDQHGRPARVGTMPGVKKHKTKKKRTTHQQGKRMLQLLVIWSS